MTTPEEPVRPQIPEIPPPEVLPALDERLPQQVAEALLRTPEQVVQFTSRNARTGRLFLWESLIAILGLVAYGVLAASFSGGRQFWSAPAKILLTGFLSALICFPSFFTFSCLAGIKASFRDLFGMVLGSLAVTALLLLGFAPVVWVFSQSTQSLAFMGLLHLIFLFVALRYGLRIVGKGFLMLGGARRAQLAAWIGILVLVVLQMTTALRPLIGTSDQWLPGEKKFFLTHWMDCLEKEAD